MPCLVFATLCLAGCGGSDGAQETPVIAGRLLTTEPQSQYPALADASENYLITYMSTSATGRDIVVSGQVAIPKGTPPAGGFPVISYAWGTNGPSDNCAASNGGAGSRSVNDYLNTWVKRGYAVLQTDYEGWGTPGQPTENGRSNANAVANIVTAAHSVSDKLSNDWLVLGHSLGGGAALWTAGLMQQTGGKYNLKGAIADAPTGPGILKFVNDAARGGTVAQPAQPFISLLALAFSAVDPTVDLNNLIAEPMMPQVVAAQTKCIGELIGQPQLKPGQYFKAGPTFDALAKYVNEQDASALTMKVPVFVAQAGNDQTTVTPETTRAMVKTLCSRGANIQYKEYPGESHGSLALASATDAFNFAAAAFSGSVKSGACPQ